VFQSWGRLICLVLLWLKVKIKVLQKTLESSKNSLQLMSQVLDLAQKKATPRQVDLTLLLVTYIDYINYNQSIDYRHHSRR
jgi:hypothetical protein